MDSSHSCFNILWVVENHKSRSIILLLPTPINFIRAAISALVLESTTSLRDYAISFDQSSSIMLSKNAINKKFNNYCVNFLENTLKYFCKNIVSNYFTFALLPGIKAVNIVDSSEVRLNDKLQNEFPGMRQFKSLLKVQTIIDCLQGTFKKLEITPGRHPDQGYKGHIECIDSGTLLISDLGYFSCENMKEIVDKRGCFLTRYKRGLICHSDNGNEILLTSMLKNAKRNVIDMNILAGKQYNIACRLIAIKLSEAEYNKRLLNIKKQLNRI